MFHRIVSQGVSKPPIVFIHHVLIIGSLVFLSNACRPTPPTSTGDGLSSPQDYVGRIVDEVTQSAIDGAQVSLDMPGEGDPPIKYTDSEGVFHFTLLIDRSIDATIRVEASGYKVYTRNITILPEQAYFEDIRLVRFDPAMTTVAPTLSVPGTTIVLTPPAALIDPVTGSTIPSQPQPQVPTRVPPSATLAAAPTSAPPTNPPVSGCIELLNGSWHLSGSGPLEEYDGDMDYRLQGRTYIQVIVDLHGFTALSGDASAIFFDQPPFGEAHFASLADYADNGRDGIQTVSIPLSAFYGLNPNDAVGTMHTRFWSEDGQTYVVDITSIKACA